MGEAEFQREEFRKPNAFLGLVYIGKFSRKA